MKYIIPRKLPRVGFFFLIFNDLKCENVDRKLAENFEYSHAQRKETEEMDSDIEKERGNSCV